MNTRNKIFTLASLALTSVVSLAGCNNNNVASGSSQTSDNEITTSETQVTSYEKSQVRKMLDNLSKGFTLKGSVLQSRVSYEIKNDGSIVPYGQPEQQTYNVNILYENSDERIGTSVVQLGDLEGFESVISELSAYMDEEGNCYQEYLDYKNDIQIRYLMENENKLSFTAAGLNNFADILIDEDFSYDEDANEYSLNPNKIGLIFNNLLGHINAGFRYMPSNVTMGVKDDNFTSLDFGLEEFEKTSVEQDKFIKTKYKNNVSFEIIDIGTTKLPRIKKYEAKPENAELKNAFNNIGKNMTLDVESRISINEGATNVSYRQFRFDGENVLVHDYDDPHRKGLLNKDNHFVLKTLQGSASDYLYCHTLNIADNTYIKSEHKKFAKNYQGVYFYDELLPNPSVICSDFFTYDNDVNEYTILDDDIISQVIRLLMVSKDPLVNEYALNANKIGVRIGDDGQIKYVKLYVDYQDIFQYTYVKGFVKVNFSKINETTLGVTL